MSASSTPENDAIWADDFRKRLEASLQPVLELLSEAKARKVEVALNMGPVWGDRIGLVGLKLHKEI